jgi:hypothetical protein
MFSRSDTGFAVVVTGISAALLIWVAVTGLRLSGQAPAGLGAAGRTLNIVALIHIFLYVVHAAMIFASL